MSKLYYSKFGSGEHVRHLIIISLVLLFTFSSQAEIPELIGTIQADTTGTRFGFRIIPMGDQNNDGYDDFIAWGYDFRAYLYYGGTDLDTSTTYALRFDSVQGRFNQIGDLNNDGYNDFLTGGRSLQKWKQNLYFGGPTMDTIRDHWFGMDTLRADGYNAYSDDINQNGSPEVFSYGVDRGSLFLFELGNDFDSVPDFLLSPPNMIKYIDYVGFGEGITTGDYNGDNIVDLIINLRPPRQDSLNGQLYVYFGGDQFDTIPDLIFTRPGSYQVSFEKYGMLLEHLGDVNADGYDDFLAGSSEGSADTVAFIYFGGPQFDSLPDILLTENISNGRSAGDLNGDGENDIITSFPLPFSGSGHVNIYYGGKDIDNIPDITIRNSDMPGWQDYFGTDCTGLGDVNGDGINDFGFSAINNQLKGAIYIYSGKGSATDIGYDYEPNLPDDFELKQNYPNPFNPSTTIEFAIPKSDHVTLSLYNSIGQKVITLIDKQLSAGTYKIEWDSKNKSGDRLSSGIYFYKLQTGEYEQSKKMILLK